MTHAPEEIRAAIRATEYKYFGDYEMSDDQRSAVDVLVEVAQHHLTAAPELLEVAKTLLAFTKGTIERAGLTDTNGIVAASEAVIAKVIP